MFDTFLIYFFLSTVGGKILASPYTLTLYYNIKEVVLANYRQLDLLYPMKFVISNHHAHVDFLVQQLSLKGIPVQCFDLRMFDIMFT